MKTNPYRFRIAALAVLALGVGCAQAQTTTTYSGANGAYNSDTWNNAALWSSGIPTDPAPSAPWNVVIADNWHAGVATANVTPVYTGNLTLGAGSQLTIGEGSGANGLRALGTGSITFNTGSRITLRHTVASSTHSQNFIMSGNATFAIGSSTAAHNDDRTLTGVISGVGQMSVPSTNGQRLTIQNTNPLWSGGIIMGGALSESKNEGLRANAAGAFGTGNVTVNDGVGLLISVADAIGDAATLSLSGGDGEEAFKLNMGAADTVDRLLVDGYPQPAGTYGALASAADYKRAWITGASLLTVSTAPADTPTTVTFAGTGPGGSTSSVYNTEPVTYTITFNEPHTPALTSADLENSTATPVTIGSVTPLPLTGGMTTVSYRVVVTPTATGTLNLQIKSGTVINDLFGNALVVPAADNDTLTVDALPAIACEVGVWKPWSNNRINPVTGLAWAVGDTYRLIMVTSGTTTFNSNDIADYNAFVQAQAAASTKYTELGDATWKVLGSTEAVNAKVNTGTDTGAGVSVILMDGATLLANNNADLWNGTAARPDIAGTFMSAYLDQNEVEVTSGSIGTGTNQSGATAASQWFGNSGGSTKVNTGLTRPNNNSRWMIQFNTTNDTALRVFALSNPLTLQAVGGGDTTPPTLTSIVDDKSGGPVTVNTLVTYTVTFDEDIDDASVTAADFDNEGTAAVTIGSIAETTPTSGIFTVQVTPTSVGSLKLRIKSDAVIEDTSGNDLVVPVSDDTTITVQTHYQAWAGGAAFGDDANGDGVSNGLAFLLGAANPSANAQDLLPKVDETDGNLVLTFSMRNALNRGDASLNVEHSSDLGLVDAWEAALVPNTSGTVNDVVFAITADGILNDVIATIPASKAAGGKLFGRVESNE
jgi:hypothetical protein